MPEKESWIARNWRPTSAMVYLMICICDFMAMPIYYEAVQTQRYSPAQIVAITSSIGKEGGSQVDAMRVFLERQRWVPMTLGENGLFHVAFGAILGAAAWTRGQEKKERVTNGTTE